MNEELKIWIKNNLLNKLGIVDSCRVSIRWFEKTNNLSVYNKIIKLTSFLNSNCYFSERIYCILHDLITKKHCLLCDNPVKYLDFNRGYRIYCSHKCLNNSPLKKQHSEETCFQKYGVKNPIMLIEFQEKAGATNLIRYGDTCSARNQGVKDKQEITNLSRHGHKCTLHGEEGKKKKIQTWQKKYGKDHPSKSPIVRNKTEETNLKRLGTKHTFLNQGVKEKGNKTVKAKYGVDNVFQSEIIKQKIGDTNELKCGYRHPMQSPIIKENFKNTSKLRYNRDNPAQRHISLDNLKLLKDPDWLKKENQSKCASQIAKDLGVTLVTVLTYLKKHNIPLIYHFFSKGENEVVEHIKNQYYSLIITKTHKIIPPYELDIYLPEISLAIEFDGIYWHSNKPSNYHLNKTLRCQEKGIQLLHIFENEWKDPLRQEIWKSIINSKLGRNKQISSEDCLIKEINNIEYKEFIENNSLQEYLGTENQFGLFYNNDMIIVMGYIDKSVIFCNKIYLDIINGEKKLLDYYMDHYNPERILVETDLRYSNGDIYKQLNFDYLYHRGPNQHDVKIGNQVFSIFDCGNVVFLKETCF